MDKSLAEMSVEELDQAMTEEAVSEQVSDVEAEGAETQSEILSPENVSEEAPDQSEATNKEAESQEVLAVESLQKRIAEMEANLQNKEALMGKWANEIGTIRKQFNMNADPELKVDMPTDEEFYNNPREATEKLLKAKEAAARHQQEAYARQIGEVKQRNKVITNHFVEGFEDRMTDIQEMLREDGLGDDVVKMFSSDPYSTDHTTLVQIGKRAILRQQLGEAQKKIADLEAKITELKGKPDEMLDKIDRAARNAPMPSKGSKDKGNVTGGLSIQQLASTSYEDLERLLKENQ